MNQLPFFSIVIPTRNESADILTTLKSIAQNSFQNHEVLVVDASTDDTPLLVSNFGDSRFQLLKQDNRDGRCGARNQGIRASKGEVVVILNADVQLPSDFLEQLKKHYDDGADYVIVEATVLNKSHPFGAMVEAEHQFYYKSGVETVNWSEGYSCRRSCALNVGLFPEKLALPICAGEDAIFGDRIAQRYNRVYDPKILVAHTVPEELSIYWSQRVGRGEGCAQRQILLDKKSYTSTLCEGVIWSLKTILWIGLFFPMYSYANKLSSFVSLKTSSMIWPVFLSRLGHEVGRWRGLFRLRRHSRKTAAE
jgi:glycosyltransferase involved in cell wall biosynthesis